MTTARSPHCLVCGVPLTGAAATLLRWRGIGRSPRSPDTCTQCGAHLEEGRLVELTVLFADISSFTDMTNRLGASETAAVVDEFLRLASKTLASHGAFIDKFIGDAVMAFFNVPIKRADHAAAAVAAAAELQRQLPLLSDRLKRPVRASIGIATGYARVGRIGSDDLKDYTAIGAAVNQAARLQAKARPTEIVVSQAVYRAVASVYPGVAAESLTLKGFSEATLAYRLNGEPAAPIADPAWAAGRPAMDWTAVILALLGGGCLAGAGGTVLVAAFGGGSAGALYALSQLFDKSALRPPVLAAAAAVALATLVSLARQRRLRRECLAKRSCLEMTPGEKKRVRLAAALAASALFLVCFEVWAHYFVGHPLLPKPGITDLSPGRRSTSGSSDRLDRGRPRRGAASV